MSAADSPKSIILDHSLLSFTEYNESFLAPPAPHTHHLNYIVDIPISKKYFGCIIYSYG